MILVHNISLAPQEDAGILRKKAAEKLRIPTEQITECVLKKRSLDARKKDRIHYVCTVGVSVTGSEEKLLRRCRNRDITPDASVPYVIHSCASEERPVVIGFGPAGMFASLVLAKAGLRPIVLERGQDALSRRQSVGRKPSLADRRLTVFNPAGRWIPRIMFSSVKAVQGPFRTGS